MIGGWSGLVLALVAAAFLDLLLLGSFGWSELIEPVWRNSLWTGLGVFWIVAVMWSVRQCRRWTAAGLPDPTQDAFPEALDCYLKGDYYQAEHVLRGLLQRNARDLDAHLMLATLLRRVGRCEEAARQLDVLTRFEGAGKWELEMQRERKLIAEAAQKPTVAAA
jgi:hypothetical protein